MKIRRILAFILAAIMVLSLFSCSKNEKEKDRDENKNDNGSVAGSPAAVWSETTVVSEAMFTYFYNAYYRYFLETYQKSLSSMGLDPSMSLSLQKQSEEYT